MTCSECGGISEIAARNARRYVDRPYMCADCRNPAKIVVTQQLRDYWLDRFTVDEILQLAADAFG